MDPFWGHRFAWVYPSCCWMKAGSILDSLSVITVPVTLTFIPWDNLVTNQPMNLTGVWEETGVHSRDRMHDKNMQTPQSKVRIWKRASSMWAGLHNIVQPSQLIYWLGIYGSRSPNKRQLKPHSVRKHAQVLPLTDVWCHHRRRSMLQPSCLTLYWPSSWSEDWLFQALWTESSSFLYLT